MPIYFRMLFPCLPKIKRCCYCTKNLKIACLFIVIWSMLSTCHSFRILMWPICTHQYDENVSDLNDVLNYIRWILVFINMFTLLTSFAFLKELFFKRQMYIADLFMCAAIFSAVLMLAHGISNILYVVRSNNCDNISDGLAHIVYFCVWCYFILVVNTYSEERQSGAY